MPKFKVGDRVKRLPAPNSKDRSGEEGSAPVMDGLGTNAGCRGVVKVIAEETSAAATESKEKTLMYQIDWDNGTKSVMGADRLTQA